MGTASLKMSSSDEMLDSRWLIDSGMFSTILGDWFDWVLNGLANGLNFPVFRSSVTSRKLTTFLFASTVFIAQ